MMNTILSADPCKGREEIWYDRNILQLARDLGDINIKIYQMSDFTLVRVTVCLSFRKHTHKGLQKVYGNI